MAFHRDVQPADAPGLDALELCLGRLDQGQDLFGQAQQAHARGGQAHGLGATHEQLGTRLFLQRLDLVGQRALRDVQHLGGAGQAALFVDRMHGAQMAQFQMHDETPSR